MYPNHTTTSRKFNQSINHSLHRSALSCDPKTRPSRQFHNSKTLSTILDNLKINMSPGLINFRSDLGTSDYPPYLAMSEMRQSHPLSPHPQHPRRVRFSSPAPAPKREATIYRVLRFTLGNGWGILVVKEGSAVPLLRFGVHGWEGGVLTVPGALLGFQQTTPPPGTTNPTRPSVLHLNIFFTS